MHNGLMNGFVCIYGKGWLRDVKGGGKVHTADRKGYFLIGKKNWASLQDRFIIAETRTIPL